MCDEHGFSKERVLTAEKKMEKINSPQNSLDAWF
jgi:hypothetical protein